MRRFISVDPLRGTPFDPQQRNRYTFTGNNPLVRYDLSDLAWCDDSLEEDVAQAVELAYDLYIKDVVVFISPDSTWSERGIAIVFIALNFTGPLAIMQHSKVT
ncbi:MAG: RHS repeat-associated core domain-containing protein [Thermoleophilia bacterium]